MLRIKKITIENFRGIKLPTTIDFEKGGKATSAILYGRNGTGKSSIVDAWEWLLSFGIKKLSGEGFSQRDYPHMASGGVDSGIKVEFAHNNIKSANVAFNKSKISVPTISGEYDAFKQCSIYPNFLRYSDLQSFVYMSKTEKYAYIARFFGLERFTKNQSDMQASITRIRGMHEKMQGTLDDVEAEVKRITQRLAIDDATVVKFINGIAQKHNIATITEFKQNGSVKAALDAIVKKNPVALTLSEWKIFQAKLFKFYPLGQTKADAIALEKAFEELKKDEANVSKLILLELYESAKETIGNLEDKTICPVCDTKYSGDLLGHVSKKHKALAELQKAKSEYDAKKAVLEKKFTLILAKIIAIQSEESATVLREFHQFFVDLTLIANDLNQIAETLKTPLKDLAALAISSEQALGKIDSLHDDEVNNKKKVADAIKKLEDDKRTKDLADDHTALATVILKYTEYLKTKKKVEYLKKIVDDMSAFFAHLTAYIQGQIQATFNSIQADVVECYDTLENSNQYLKNPEIKLVADKDKAVELEIEFANEKISPAHKYMSESQVSSFGLAIFLSAVKHFNSNFKFVILDDVVSSFDAFKRAKVSQLLEKKFGDFQMLLLTHDNIFFETIQKDFPQWNRYKFTSWDYATGPRFRLAENYKEEIAEYIKEDKPIVAGSALGRYLEWTFGVVNENLQTPIRYKIENAYTLAEFYEPLVKRFKDKLKQSGKSHKLVQAFEDFDQSTIFRNYCAHWKNEASTFTSDEIDAIFKKWIAIEQMMYCATCKSYVKFDGSTGTEYVRCNCGVLNLKDDSFYT